MKNPKSVLITGASSGIGAALAEVYAAPEVRIFLGGRSMDRLAAVSARCEAKGAQVEAASIDVTDQEAIANWIEDADRKAPLELVIANAAVTGGLREGHLPEALERATRLLSVNLIGELNTLHPAMDLMIARGRGQVVLVGSMAGYRGFPYSPAYSASKAAIKIYGEALRSVLAKKGVTLSTVVPGFVDTPLNDIIDAPKPFLMSPERFARRVRKRLERGQGLICLPRRLYLLTLLHTLVPRRLSDFFMSRISVGIPETPLASEASPTKPPDRN